MRTFSKKHILALGLALIVSTPMAQAAVVSDGDTDVVLSPVTSATASDLAGTVIFDQLRAFDLSGAVSGNLQTRVVRRDSDNLYNFAYRLRDLSYTGVGTGPLAPLTTLTVGGFDDFGPLEVLSRSPTISLGATAITSVSRTGGTFTFDISNLFTESGSTFFVIKTSADSFVSTATSRINGGGESQLLTGVAAPTPAPIPVPASGMLLVGGLALFGAVRRWKRR